MDSREEALKLLDEGFYYPSPNNNGKFRLINDSIEQTIRKALQAKEPELVSISELAEYIGQVTVRGFEHDRCLPPNYYTAELRCILQFAEDTKEIAKELLRMYPQGIIIKESENE